jgi:hypothetical protein
VLDALALGARHGFDADHIAAISELTASERGGRRGFVAGIKYALGHAAAVAALGFAFGAAGLNVPAWVIGATLLGLGGWAAVRLAWGHAHAHVHVDEQTGRVVRHTHRHRHGIGVGVVHGLGGAPSAVLVGGRGGAALLAFTVGLLVSNGAIGALAGTTTKVAVFAWLGIAAGSAYGLALVLGVA